MELVVLLLVVSLGVNVLLSFKAVKLSNKVDSAEIELDYYKRLADYWHKHYEANKDCKAFDAMVKSQSILEEAYHELGEWYKTVTKERDEWIEDYNSLTAQYNTINSLLSHVSDDRERVTVLLGFVIQTSLRDKDLYDRLYDISNSFFMDYYVIPEHDDDNGEYWYADEYIYNLYDEDDKYGGKFYWDYADELAGRDLYVYYYNEIGM
jgi:hypothetical protein